MLSYKNDLSLAEQTKLDALLADEDMTNKVVLLVTEEFEIVNKEMFNKMNIKKDDKCLVIGLGNERSTPDSLGPLVINKIIVTNHFFSMGINVEEGFRSTAAFNPGVMGQTGLETSDVITAIVNNVTSFIYFGPSH